MKKEDIIKLATSMGYKLDYDKSEDREYEGSSSTLRFFRFVSIDDSLDEKDLRWIWYMEDTDEVNINRGEFIKKRLAKKKELQEFLKY